MKDWKCGECGTVRESKDDCIIFICPACVSEMKVVKSEERAEIIIFDWLKNEGCSVLDIYFNRSNKINAKIFQTSGLNKKPDFVIKIDRGYGVEYIAVEVKPAFSSKNIHRGKKILDYYENYLLGQTKYLIEKKPIKISHFVLVSDQCINSRLFDYDPIVFDNLQCNDHWRQTNAKYNLEPKKEYSRTSDYVRGLWEDFKRLREKYNLKKLGGSSLGIIMNDIDSKKPHLMIMNFNSHLKNPKWGARYWRI